MINESISKIFIKSMMIGDLSKVLEIERQSFSHPWTYNMFYCELTKNRCASYFVLEKENEIIGYFGIWHKGSSFHITNIAISEKFRGMGYGGKILSFLEEIAITSKIKRISLEVRKSNYIAQNMYKKFGYETIKILKNYYRKDKTDALVMEKKLY